jgi:hypothetical protein
MKVKYPRTPHLPWSEGSTSDDKTLPDTSHFEGKYVIITEKMDGENTTMYRDGIHARSLDSKGGEDRDWVKALWSKVRYEIPEGWRVCGENLWARHSIPYSDLKSFFYGFSIWDSDNICLPWVETEGFFDIMGITPVRTIYEGEWDEAYVRELAQSLNTETTEGFVVRVEQCGGFHYRDFDKNVAKWVRKGHVQTDKHWRHSQIICNGLRDVRERND